MVDLVMGLAEGLPTGVYKNKGLEDYMAEVLSDPDRSNDFRELEQELLLTATDGCERLVLGRGEWRDVPIPKAVAASTALPMVYEPVELRGRHLMDGGIASTTNVDVAVEAGAVHHRRQPAGPVRERLRNQDPDDVRLSGAPRGRHGPARDRQPGLRLMAHRGRTWRSSPGSTAFPTWTSS